MIIPLDQDADNIGNFSISETFTQAQYDSLLAGGLYVNIHSATTPSGELRAQLLPDNITVIVNDLTGDAEVPAVTSASSGRASLTVNTDTLAMVLNANSDVPDATAAHIHENFAGANDAVIAADQSYVLTRLNLGDLCTAKAWPWTTDPRRSCAVFVSQ